MIDGDLKLSSEVVKLMKSDPLYPVFNYNVYLPHVTRYPKVSYRKEDFLEGLNLRVHELLKYVNNCTQEHSPRESILW